MEFFWLLDYYQLGVESSIFMNFGKEMFILYIYGQGKRLAFVIGAKHDVKKVTFD